MAPQALPLCSSCTWYSAILGLHLSAYNKHLELKEEVGRNNLHRAHHGAVAGQVMNHKATAVAARRCVEPDLTRRGHCAGRHVNQRAHSLLAVSHPAGRSHYNTADAQNSLCSANALSATAGTNAASHQSCVRPCGAGPLEVLLSSTEVGELPRPNELLHTENVALLCLRTDVTSVCVALKRTSWILAGKSMMQHLLVTSGSAGEPPNCAASRWAKAISWAVLSMSASSPSRSWALRRDCCLLATWQAQTLCLAYLRLGRTNHPLSIVCCRGCSVRADGDDPGSYLDADFCEIECRYERCC